MRLRTLSCFLALSGCLAGCKTIEFPSVPLPSARAIDGKETSAPFTFLVDTSYRHYDDGMLKWATAQLPGDTLLAWGRYPINQAGQSIERNGYKELTTAELEWFRETRLPTLPIIAPDQRILNGDEKGGRALAAKSVEQLTRVLRGWENLSPPEGVLLFLDVEGDEDPISSAFLRGWCEELQARRTAQIAFLPAIYTSALNSMSVRKAIADVHKTCHIEGLWLARYMKTLQRPTAWPDFRNTKQASLIPFPDDVPIYAWQYWARNTDPKVDLSLVNPGLVAELEQRSLRLHAPPSSAPVSLDSPTSAR